ncbi:LysR family transcriptional regulator [Mesorhizobium sp. AaZ16]|uniref:LysR family transcriptional regulator n=1 Tax=Mesorhizobium sp. AaZ16 TaxID=3402289 RepID=UPI00374E74D7
MIRISGWHVPLRQLRYATAAADHGSFRRGAEALRAKQSTLSRCILQLEERLAVRTVKRWRPVDGRRGNHANLAASCRDGCQMAGDRPSSCQEADRRVYTSV